MFTSKFTDGFYIAVFYQRKRQSTQWFKHVHGVFAFSQGF